MPDFIVEMQTASEQGDKDMPLSSIPDPQKLHAHPEKTGAELRLKGGDTFLLADVSGDLTSSKPLAGLFWHNTRFLQTCTLRLHGQPLRCLSYHVADAGDACRIDLCNTELLLDDDSYLAEGAVHIQREMQLEDGLLIQHLQLTSFHHQPLSLRLELVIGSDFFDLFEARHMVQVARGTIMPPTLRPASVTLNYHGMDRRDRKTQLICEPPATCVFPEHILWNVPLQRGETWSLDVTIMLNEYEEHGREREKMTKHALTPPEIQVNDTFFQQMLARGMHDVLMLTTQTPYGLFPYGGIPLFTCPFGRDGLVTSLEFLPWFPQLTRGTLAFLAALQGVKIEPFTDEEPGKILHEFRTGEMANRREIPYIPYYGSVDVTPLFLMTLESYIRWTDDTAFLRQMWPHAQAASSWILTYGDQDGDGFVEYQKASDKGLRNQGWKDSWDAISYKDGTLATAPLALCEVQAYTYAAYNAMSYLAERLHLFSDAMRWISQAQRLRERFLQQFWWEEQDALYLALDREKQPCDVVTSNAGQCLWTGILPQAYAERLIRRLMREDMYSGWGIRTLSTAAARYNPMSYHNGSVWPHDTAIIGAGFARYGHKAEANLLLTALRDVSRFTEYARLPELFCGFPRHQDYAPTRNPIACTPQAWATGAPFLLLGSLLGFQPDAGQQYLHIAEPTLPSWLSTLEIHGMHVGEREVGLHIARVGDAIHVAPLGNEWVLIP